MVYAETDFAEPEPELIEFLKTLDARVDSALLPEHFISALRHQHKGYPIIPGVEVPRNFIATARYILHTDSPRRKNLVYQDSWYGAPWIIFVSGRI